MNKKYIIELPETVQWVQWIVLSNSDGHAYFDFADPKDLKPYEEPDLVSVKKESYEEGYGKGFTDATYGCPFVKDCTERSYQKGLDEAWYCARKMAEMSVSEFQEVFGDPRYSTIMRKLSASEAVGVLRAYENEEKDFDEVKDVLAETVKSCNVTLDEIAEVIRKMKGEEQ